MLLFLLFIVSLVSATDTKNWKSQTCDLFSNICKDDQYRQQDGFSFQAYNMIIHVNYFHTLWKDSQFSRFDRSFVSQSNLTKLQAWSKPYTDVHMFTNTTHNVYINITPNVQGESERNKIAIDRVTLEAVREEGCHDGLNWHSSVLLKYRVYWWSDAWNITLIWY